MNLPAPQQKPGAVLRRDSDWALGLGIVVVASGSLALRVGLLAPAILMLAWMASMAVIFLWSDCGGPGKMIAVGVGLAAFGQHAALAMLVLWIASAWRKHRGSSGP